MRKIEDDERQILKKISQSTKADITKGQHVKTQLASIDYLNNKKETLITTVSVCSNDNDVDIYVGSLGFIVRHENSVTKGFNCSKHISAGM